MKNLKKWLEILIISIIIVACSNNDDAVEPVINLKSVTDCENTIQSTTLVSICVDGTDFALPNEIITFASSFYSKNDNPSNTQFLWTIKSGNMEVLNVENSIDGLLANSIATIKFNSDYSGNGVISVNAENDGGSGYAQHIVELE